MTQSQRRYAQNTTVPPEKTRAEIDALVTKHGATGFVTGWQGSELRVMFEMNGRRLRFSATLPDPTDPQFKHKGNLHSQAARDQYSRLRFEVYVRERWRLMLFLIKGKLEAIRSGAAIFEEEMMPYTVMPNGQTVGEWLNPQLEDVLSKKTLPPLLPG